VTGPPAARDRGEQGRGRQGRRPQHRGGGVAARHQGGHRWLSHL